MIILKVIGLIVLMLITFICLSRISVFVKGGTDKGAEIWFKAGMLRYKLYPLKKRAEKRKVIKTVEKVEEKTKDFTRFLDYKDAAIDFLKDLLRAIHVRWLRGDISVGGRRDAAKAAILYGKIHAAAGIIVPHLENNNNIHRYAYDIKVDFTSDKTIVYGEMEIGFTVGTVLALFLRFAAKALVVNLRLRCEKRRALKPKGA